MLSFMIVDLKGIWSRKESSHVLVLNCQKQKEKTIKTKTGEDKQRTVQCTAATQKIIGGTVA